MIAHLIVVSMSQALTDRPTPTRFGSDLAWSEKAARMLRVTAGPGARPSAVEVAALADGLSGATSRPPLSSARCTPTVR